MNAQERSVFERHPRATLAAVWLVFLVLFGVAAEVALKQLSGLGRPILFFSHPSYGYRMQPNQETWRFGGAHFKINNLGLRASRDWDASVKGKVLFLGDSVTYGGNHISNADLFSERAVSGLAGFTSGNVGMPNWGVENVYGLVVEDQFLPASVYVSTFIEHDFYRGLQRADGRPWIRFEPPAFALQELAEFFWHKALASRRKASGARDKEPGDVLVARAAAKIRAMDDFLKARGYRHLIFISPTRKQVLGEERRDARVQAQLEKHGVAAAYLLDEPVMRDAPMEERRSWYQDNVHLTPKGHAVWAELMRVELEAQLGARAPLARN